MMVGSCFVRLLLMQQWIWLGLRLQLNGCRWLKIIWSSHFGHLTRFTFYLPRAEKRRTSKNSDITWGFVRTNGYYLLDRMKNLTKFEIQWKVSNEYLNKKLIRVERVRETSHRHINKPAIVMSYSMKLGWYDCNQKWYRARNGWRWLFWYEMPCWLLM